jgi:peptidoglycan/LPS O-acetylase OafA/YrhL
MIYRTDIDGLRAIAVLSVILFHLKFLAQGYLGVDVFFVISGFLITGLAYGEAAEGKFISVETLHLSKEGAKFYARKLEVKLDKILKNN